MASGTRKKRYEKPSVTRVKLDLEHSVLQACNSNLPNLTGADPVLCWASGLCIKDQG
jgi:hypothetical protein